MTNAATMEYRRLGRTGLKVSVLSFGSWVTFDTQLQIDLALDCMQAAHDAGCNFFDNAEAYADGKSEQIMGDALAQLGWPRWSYVLTTKLFWGIHPSSQGSNVNVRNTLNRKYLLQAIDGSLERLGHDFVDVVYCHRADPDTPIEETVWAMSDIVASGKALYWGTSEWAAEEIRHAIDVAERHHLHKPVTEQPQYNLFARDRVEGEYARLFEETGYGATIWSPLASGLLTGKYRDGIPAESRGALAGFEWLRNRFTDESEIAAVERLRPIADELGCTLAQLAIAWCAVNPNVSTVITGASRPSQVTDNFGALAVLDALTPDVLERIDAALEP
jgi:voltage-dependent potassium channel beta subunit